MDIFKSLALELLLKYGVSVLVCSKESMYKNPIESLDMQNT